MWQASNLSFPSHVAKFDTCHDPLRNNLLYSFRKLGVSSCTKNIDELLYVIYFEG